MKKFVALLIVIVLLLVSCSINDTQSPQSITPGRKNSAFSGLGFSFVLPEAYERIEYNIIDGSIAEAVFWKDGRQYTFRMAEGDRDTTDIEIESGPDIHGRCRAGNIWITYNNPGKPGLAEWKTGSFSYSMYTDNFDEELMPVVILDVAQEIQEQMNPLSGDKAYMKFWAVDIGQEGYTKTGAMYIRSWRSEVCSRTEGYGMTLIVSPEAYMPLPDDVERVSFKGRDFYATYREICWDSNDDQGNWIGGTSYEKQLVWYRNGCAYSLSASTGDKNISPDMISPQTALAFEGSDAYQPAGLEMISDELQVEFISGNLRVSVRLCAKPFDSGMLGDINQESVENKDGFEYFEAGPKGPRHKTLKWETNMGLVFLQGGIPLNCTDDYPADVWDFIDADLAMSITEQIGCAPENFPR